MLSKLKLDDELLDNLQAQVDKHNRNQQLKYYGSGLQPKKKDDILSTLNIKIYKPLHEKLQEISEKTGVSQKRIVQDCLVNYLDWMEREHKKTSGWPVYTKK